MSMAADYPLRFQTGARTWATLRRRLVRMPLSLDQVLWGGPPSLPKLARDAHGYVVTSLPKAMLADVRNRAEGLHCFVRQSYVRRYADLEGGFDAYLSRFPARTRASMLRKVRRFAVASGGAIDLRSYNRPADMDAFFDAARIVSAKSYQERLLGAGLPDGASARRDAAQLAERSTLRAFVLFLRGDPVSYLYLPADGDTLLYAYLGYDPDAAGLSPGTVLQFEAMRLLMGEARFRRLDFTEGDGQHKRLFATGGVDCCDVLLLRPSAGNLTGVGALMLFDRGVAEGKALLRRPMLQPLARRLRGKG